MVAVTVSVGVVVKVLVCATAMMNMGVVVEVLVINAFSDVEIIVVGVILNVLKPTLTVSYSSVDVSSDVDVDLSMGALMLDLLSGIVFEVLADVSANAFAVVMNAFEFLVSPSSEDFSC